MKEPKLPLPDLAHVFRCCGCGAMRSWNSEFRFVCDRPAGRKIISPLCETCHRLLAENAPPVTGETIVGRPHLIHILSHTLGLDRSKEPYRNHFVTGPKSDDWKFCQALVGAGLMEDTGPYPLDEFNYSHVFRVTPAGREVLRTLSILK